MDRDSSSSIFFQNGRASGRQRSDWALASLFVVFSGTWEGYGIWCALLMALAVGGAFGLMGDGGQLS